MNTYEISSDTLYIKLDYKKRTKVVTIKKELITSETILEVINNSCCYYGSSYLGRLEGSKSLLNSSIKVPIIIEDSKEIIFFPTKSPRIEDCIWISYNNIERYIEKDDKTIIYFRKNKILEIDTSFYIIDNQINRCLKLEKELRKRRKNM